MKAMSEDLFRILLMVAILVLVIFIIVAAVGFMTKGGGIAG